MNQITIPGNREDTILFIKDLILKTAREEIDKKGFFSIALSGGSTPNAVYKSLSKEKNAIDWSRVKLFWGDERAVPCDHEESNYKNAMDAGLSTLPIKEIFRMEAERKDIDQAACDYEMILKKETNASLDLLLLGLGDDGHTASLFPHTAALTKKDRLVVANFVPEKNQYRMTLTYPAIALAKKRVLIALGDGKASIVKKVIIDKKACLPVQKIEDMLWILDTAASQKLGKQK